MAVSQGARRAQIRGRIREVGLERLCGGQSRAGTGSQPDRLPCRLGPERTEAALPSQLHGSDRETAPEHPRGLGIYQGKIEAPD